MQRRIAPLRDLRAVSKLVARFRAERPTIVHSHTPKGGLLGMIAATIARVPVRVYHMRGLPLMTATGLKRRLLVWTERLSCALAHRVIVVSHSLRQAALDERLVGPEKAVVLLGGSGNGVDNAGRFNPDLLSPALGADTRRNFGIPEDATVVGFIGRIVRDKGVVELTRAWGQLRAEFLNAHLLLVGPLEAEDPVPHEILGQLQDDDRVHMIGADWDTPRLYAAMDFVVLPSYREGFPNVPLEAASMGRAVITTRVPGCIDAVVDHRTGLIVPPRDSDGLRDAIRAYLVNPELRAAHGRAGQARVRAEFRREAIWEALAAEYEMLVASRVRAVRPRARTTA